MIFHYEYPLHGLGAIRAPFVLHVNPATTMLHVNTEKSRKVVPVKALRAIEASAIAINAVIAG
jgi:hypothetical protein